jgi:lipid II isoglutaminyl synthase (glutamine-hydrolysing)
MTTNEKKLRLLQLYPRDMNIYGDWGNTLALKRRIQWHGYDVEVIDYNPEDTFPDNIDIVIGGGGQDSGQSKIQDDLLAIGPRLQSMADDNVPMLMICGLYQLFGHFFRTKDGEDIKGIGILDVETHASNTRLIGNIITDSQQFGEIVGYENHSGLTTLGSNVQPFGRVIKGAGNNGRDDSEGARYRNVIGSYLHGSLLPKNPRVADGLIEQACLHKFGDYSPTVIEDRFAEKARAIALKRPR